MEIFWILYFINIDLAVVWSVTKEIFLEEFIVFIKCFLEIKVLGLDGLIDSFIIFLNIN